MAFKEHIDDIRNQIKKGLFQNEASVSQGIVLRLLDSLDWPKIDEKGSLSWADLKEACVEHFGCKSETSGSIGASLRVMEEDGLVNVIGRGNDKKIVSCQSLR